MPWQAIAFANGRWRPVPVYVRDNETPSAKASYEAADKFITDPYRGLLRHFAQEVELSRPPFVGREAIELWAGDAANENKRYNADSLGLIEAHDGALALNWRGALPSEDVANPVTLAWHDRSFALFALTGEEERVLVEYVPSAAEVEREELLRRRYATPDHTLETILEWRGYYGEECAIVDSWNAMLRRGNALIASVKGSAGYGVGWVLRRLRSTRKPLFATDPTYASRLARMDQQFPDVAKAVPNLATVANAPIKTEAAVVFVHGTFSCGMQGLKDLYPPASLNSSDPAAKPRHVYRYEHDTFLKPFDNAEELAKLIEQRLDADRLLIAAHSRGGLVARAARFLLAKKSYRGKVTVYTFGTPHRGTPLVDIGQDVLNCLWTIGENVVGAIPLTTPLTKAFSYVYSPSDLPPGIEVMDEQSQALGMLNGMDDPQDVYAWGGHFDVAGGPSGFGVTVEGFLRGALGNVLHDLVVPAASALGFGHGQPVVSCSHTQYFCDPAIRAVIRAHEPPLPPPTLFGGNAAAMMPPIVHGPDYVIIGGIRVNKRTNNPP